MGRCAFGLLERPGKMIERQACGTGERVEIDVFVQMGLNIFANAPQCGRPKPTARIVRGVYSPSAKRTDKRWTFVV
jgi:hypothetical protein